MLEITGLTKHYGDVAALQDCTFVAAAGRLTGFLGPNGAGKTTTMRAIFGLVLPDAGEIRWRGEPVTAAHRRRFGYMPEERGLYPKMPLGEQVTHFGFVAGMSRPAASAACDRWLERLGLADRRDAAIDELSHGNQQRAQLAVALVHDPQVLVLDEPFSGLDPIAVDDLGTLLSGLATDGRTVLFSSHQLDLVEDLCEDVVVIDHGSVVLDGPLQQLHEQAKHWHLAVELSGAPPDWYRDVPGVELVRRDDGRLELTAERSVDLRSILDQVPASARIERVDYDPPTLSQLFREAVRR